MTDDRAERISRLRVAFDDAALSPSRWADALRDLAHACGAAHGQLIGLGGPGAVMFNWISDGSEALVNILHDPAVYDPETNYRVIAGIHATENEVIGEDRYRAIIDRLKSRDYVRIAERYGLQNGVQTNLSIGNGQIVGLATLRADPTREEERAMFAEIVPFARTAVRIQAALDHQGTQLLAGTLEAMRRAAFILDGAGAVQALTPEADRLLSAGAPFRLAGNQLRARHLDDDAQLQAIVARALAPDRSGSTHHALVVRGDDGAPPHVIDIVAMPAREWAMHFRPRVIVTVRDRDIRPDSTDLLRAAFGLTATEAEIAQALAAGTARCHIAEARGISEHTIRAHLKSIFAKVGVNREIELAVRLRDFVTCP